MKVYTASTLALAPFWVDLFSRLGGRHQNTARWVDHYKNDPNPYASGNEPDPVLCRERWIEDHEDVAKADVVLVWGRPWESLRGALVEAGMAIALGRRVVVVGENQFYRAWSHHPRVARVPTIEDAVDLIDTWEVELQDQTKEDERASLLIEEFLETFYSLHDRGRGVIVVLPPRREDGGSLLISKGMENEAIVDQLNGALLGSLGPLSVDLSRDDWSRSAMSAFLSLFPDSSATIVVHEDLSGFDKELQLSIVSSCPIERRVRDFERIVENKPDVRMLVDSSTGNVVDCDPKKRTIN